MDFVDKKLLNILQGAFPVDSHPYQTLGLKMEITEQETFQRIENLKSEKIIRRMGGIFDSAKLGYVSTLCAARIPDDKITVLAEQMQNITEITHNYLRNHHYNLWFTIIASSPQRLEQILKEIRDNLGSDDVHSLPAKKIFKIKVCMNLLEQEQQAEIPTNGDREILRCSAADTIKDAKKETSLGVNWISEGDKALIRLLQDNLPHTLTPYSDLAKELNLEEEDVLAKIDSFLDRGILRRLGAVLYHHRAGFTSNAMGAWRVPEQLVNMVGIKMAGFKEVSHCYERPVLPEFPYNLYTMIHGHSDKECREIMAKISLETGIKDYMILFSQTELKKSSMRYFIE